MSERETVVELVISRLSGLLDVAGFKEPTVEDSGWVTRILYPHGNGEIGIEVELDWREGEAFFLVVRLENGAPPAGYYMDKGRRCRIHIQRIEIDGNSDNQNPERMQDRSGAKRGTRGMEDSISEAEGILKRSITSIVQKGQSIFD